MLKLVLAAGCLWLLATAPALAGDRNSLPPEIELHASGREGFVGPRSEALAYFSTSAIAGLGDDPSREYTPGSKVTFACAIDGRPLRCPAEYIPIEEGGVLLAATQGGPGQQRSRPSFFDGYVPTPKHLTAGPHTITVVASDEDGTDLTPPSVTVFFDPNPPSAPELTQAPPRRSWTHKPIFRFTASDDIRLVRADRQFNASLRRLRPPGDVYREDGASSFLELWFPRCPTLLTCSSEAQARYFANERRYSFGEPEWLSPGVYEFKLRTRDAVGNKSPLTTYRFRILRGKPR